MILSVLPLKRVSDFFEYAKHKIVPKLFGIYLNVLKEFVQYL